MYCSIKSNVTSYKCSLSWINDFFANHLWTPHTLGTCFCNFYLSLHSFEAFLLISNFFCTYFPCQYVPFAETIGALQTPFSPCYTSAYMFPLKNQQSCLTILFYSPMTLLLIYILMLFSFTIPATGIARELGSNSISALQLHVISISFSHALCSNCIVGTRSFSGINLPFLCFFIVLCLIFF